MAQKQAHSAFSYIELLIVTAIISILYAICLGPSSRVMQERRRADCARRLGQTYLALELYAKEHNGAFPSVPGSVTSDQPLNLLIPQYTTDTQGFICPASGHSDLPAAKPILGKQISYAYYMGQYRAESVGLPLMSDSQTTVIAVKIAGEPLFGEKRGRLGGNHGTYGGNILFTDGHVETCGLGAPRTLAPGAGVMLLNPRP